MKKSLLIASILAVALAACGKKEDAPAAPTITPAAPAAPEVAPAAAPAAPADAAAAPAAAPAETKTEEKK